MTKILKNKEAVLYQKGTKMTEKIEPEDWEIVGDRLVRYKRKDEHVIVPDTIKVVGESAFAWNWNSNIKRITLPRHLTRIEHGAFGNCRALEEIDMPESLESLGEAAFFNCGALKSLVIPEGVRFIGHRTLTCCNNLQELTLPDTLCDCCSMPTENKNVIIRAHRGSCAERIAACLAPDRFVPLPGELRTGFYPSDSKGVRSNDSHWGDCMVYFANPSKGICKEMVMGSGHLSPGYGFEHPELIEELYHGRAYALRLGLIEDHIVFLREDDRFKAIWTLQDPDDLTLEEPIQHLSLYAYLNDEGKYITRFKIYQLGETLYEGTDFEEKLYQDFQILQGNNHNAGG